LLVKKKAEPPKKKATIKAVPIKNKLISKLTDDDTCTLPELSVFTGLSEIWLKKLQQKGIIKPLPNNGNRKAGNLYPTKKTLLAIFKYYQELVDSRGSKEPEDTAKTKDAILKVKLKKEFLELAQMEGTLHKAEDIERVVGAGLSRLRINLLAIPLGVAPLIKDRDNVNEIAEIIRERIYRALLEVATIDIKKMMAEEEGLQPE